MSNIITVKDMCLWYGDHQALKDIQVEIPEMSITAFIGPSGCGKSTFLRCLNLLEVPDSGDIWIDGEKITDVDCDVNKLRQKMGMVFQHFNVFNISTIAERNGTL